MSQAALSNWDQVLEAVPVRNAAVVAARPAAGGLLLKLPLRPTWFMKPPWTWLLPVGRERKILLDQLGTEVWDICDGRHTTAQIVTDFAARHRLTYHEARLAVGQFLGMLMARKLLALVGGPRPKEPA